MLTATTPSGHPPTPASGLHAEGTEKVWGDGFEIETLLSLRTAAAGLAITEVPSFEWHRR